LKQENYTISIKNRKIENLHIVFWLLKDLSWCMVWKPLGILMIIPTLIISVVIAYRSKHILSEWCHNIAVTLWITANSYWMVSEFVKIDAIKIYGDWTYKHLAIIPFVLGILPLIYYYAFKHKKVDPKIAVAKYSTNRKD
jgi:uncharacterized membrane protein